MVTPSNPNPTDVPVQDVPRHDRGFVREEAVVVSTPMLAPMASSSYFWGSVVAGSLFVMSLFVLSWSLMLGFHVGVDHGLLALGRGAALWMVITSCIAFYCGGMIAGSISPSLGSGWLKGAAVWALSIPLTFVILGFVANAALGAIFMPRAVVVETGNAVAADFGVNTGTMWAVVITLICGLIFSIIGGMSPMAAMFGRSCAGTQAR